MIEHYFTMAKTLVAHRWYTVKARMKDDTGITTTEVALITGALLVAAGLLVAAIKAKLAEKIGIINSN